MERAGVCHGNTQGGVFPDNTPDVWGGTDIIREVGSGIGVDLHRHTALIGPRENTVVIGTVHGVAGIGGVNFYAQKFFLFQGLFQERQGRFDWVADIDIRETEEAVFRLKVKRYKWHTFTAEELARMCGMSYSHFRSRFEEYYGCSATDWLRQERISRIKEYLSYRPELTLKEVAERNRFLSASNFTDFCNQQVLKTPGELQQEGYEEWCDRRMKYWNGES